MKKRKVNAQAGIITIILIVLLVMAGFIIVYNIYMSFIKKSSKQIEILPIFVKGEVGYSLLDENKTIILNFVRGVGGENILGVKFIFQMNDDRTYFYTNTTYYPEELETKKYIIDVQEVQPALNDFTDLKKASVYFIYADSNGATRFTPYDIASADLPNSPTSQGRGVKCYDICSSNFCNGTESSYYIQCVVNSNGCNVPGQRVSCGEPNGHCSNGTCVFTINMPATNITIINGTIGGNLIFN